MFDHRQRPEDPEGIASEAGAGRALLASLLGLLALGACSGDDDGPARQGSATTAAAPPASRTVDEETAAARRIEIVAPPDGASVEAPVALEVRVQGFELVEPDGDTSGATGHLHAFVDRERLPPPERIIPSSAETPDFWSESVTLTDLAPGRHTITVVASDGYRVPFAPPVFDRITLDVG